jgi:hypothetical protein
VVARERARGGEQPVEMAQGGIGIEPHCWSDRVGRRPGVERERAPERGAQLAVE